MTTTNAITLPAPPAAPAAIPTMLPEGGGGVSVAVGITAEKQKGEGGWS